MFWVKKFNIYWIFPTLRTIRSNNYSPIRNTLFEWLPHERLKNSAWKKIQKKKNIKSSRSRVRDSTYDFSARSLKRWPSSRLGNKNGSFIILFLIYNRISPELRVIYTSLLRIGTASYDEHREFSSDYAIHRRRVATYNIETTRDRRIIKIHSR